MTPQARTLAPARRRVLILSAIAALTLVPIGSVQAETLTVAAVNFRFEPETRTASVGDVVRWTFAGDPHTVTSGAPGAPDGRFDSGIKNPGDSYQVTLSDAGTFRYFCAIHPEQMFGTLVVSGGSDPTPKPTAKPTPRPTAKPTAPPTVSPTTRPTARPTPEATEPPTAAPSATPAATASATSASTPTPTASPTPSSPTPSSPTPSAGGSPTPEASASPDPGTAAAAVDPVPIVAALTVLVALVGGGLAWVRRSRRV
jgi:plastocyanin